MVPLEPPKKKHFLCERLFINILSVISTHTWMNENPNFSFSPFFPAAASYLIPHCLPRSCIFFCWTWLMRADEKDKARKGDDDDASIRRAAWTSSERFLHVLHFKRSRRERIHEKFSTLTWACWVSAAASNLIPDTCKQNSSALSKVFHSSSFYRLLLLQLISKQWFLVLLRSRCLGARSEIYIIFNSLRFYQHNTCLIFSLSRLVLPRDGARAACARGEEKTLYARKHFIFLRSVCGK
jgi:hypothetical protein